uniref:Uncharacterized protein n=1 Tax=Anguilla anguilla TaxID=7936 RepID=A0A0E9PEK2_ANGAN
MLNSSKMQSIYNNLNSVTI